MMEHQNLTKATAPDIASHHYARRESNHAPQPLHQLLRAFANSRLGSIIQAKLKVSNPSDEYEHEADRIADQVMRMPDDAAAPPRLSRYSLTTTVQRACAKCEDEEEAPGLQRKAADESDEDLEARGKVENGKHSDSKVAAQVESLRVGGEVLPATVRNFFEPRFGRDFSLVRVHTGSLAAESVGGVRALAYTVGRNIVFGAGQYSPDTNQGRHLLAHELAHTVQQGWGRGLEQSGNDHKENIAPRPSGVPQIINRTIAPVVQRTPRDDEEFANILSDGGSRDPPQRTPRAPRITPPNPTATPPPGPTPLPAPGSFAPLTGSALTDRRAHGMSTDSGPMIGEIESEMFPTGGSNPPCTPQPPGFETTIAGLLSMNLLNDVPSLAPASQPDPMTIAGQSAAVAMPIITSAYSPHAPSVPAATFMSIVSRKPTNFGDPIRNNDADFSEFLEWYAGENQSTNFEVTTNCGVDSAWWDAFVLWLSSAAGASWNSAPHNIRERCALFDTFNTTVTQSRLRIQLGRGFELWNIPHTVVHEAMHLFQHADLDTQINLLPNIRPIRDIIIEGFAEYLARGVRDRVVTALQGGSGPPPLSAADEANARAAAAYPAYFDSAVTLRDILYRHGQDGEESIRLAFFRGEGWRFGLLESPGVGSPVETDRAVPRPVDVRFDSNQSVMLNPVVLTPIIAYVTTRGRARVEIIGRSDPVGSPADNLTLGQSRADAVQAHLVAQGINAARISVATHGEADQIAGGGAANRRATVTVVDDRNQFPGLPAPGRP
jgi:outer membrane protein OmpA-like peptidoglycan-associated protein